MLVSQSPRHSEKARFFSRCLAVIAVWWITSAPAWACNVPVFRYALERWQADPFHLAVFHAADSEEFARDVLATLEERPINVYAEAVNVDEIEADDWRLAGVELDREKLPWAVLRYPPRGGQAPPIAWSGKWDEETIALLTNSNARQEVVRRLLTGDSAVWVLVESGRQEKDEAAREALELHLTAAKKDLRIPGMDDLDYSPTDPAEPALEPPPFQDPATAIPLKVDFSMLSLSRENDAEQAFVAMLLHSEPDLHEYADEPIVFPVFGRGRSLWALVGAGINAENILESCIFLTGPCSCQIKHMNPGTDLLLDFDWQGALEGRVAPPPEMSPGMLTAVAPRLEEGEEPSSADPLAPRTELDGPVGDKGARDNSEPQEAGAADSTPAKAIAHQEVPSSASQASGAPVFVVTGVVLGGLLMVVAVATVALLGRRKE